MIGKILPWSRMDAFLMQMVTTTEQEKDTVVGPKHLNELDRLLACYKQVFQAVITLPPT
jgi:hypothetical protein